MILPDRIFSGSWIRDERLRRLPSHVQLLLIFIRSLCDRYGRFEFNPALIHLALYASANCGNVSVRDVAAWLEILRARDFIKTYTAADGRRVGEITTEYWRQKLSYGRAHFEPPVDAQPQLDLVAGSPPVGIGKKPKARVCESPPPLTSLHITSVSSAAPARDLRPAADCLPELAARWPRHDVPHQLRAATRYVRRERSDEQAEVVMWWFVEKWLPTAPEKKRALPPPPAPEADTTAATARIAAEQREKLAALVAGPQPQPGTLDHAIWLEARKTTAA